MKCNSIAKSSLVVLSLLLSVAGAHAQSVRAKVPFAFKVGSTQLPAGTYAIQNEIWQQHRHGAQRRERHAPWQRWASGNLPPRRRTN